MSRPAGYAVSLVAPPGYAHSEALREVALTVHHGLVRMGRDSMLCGPADAPERRHIVLGSHLLDEGDDALPPGAVLYNLEQVAPDSPWFDPASVARLRRHRLWDYSARNIEALERMGIVGATLVPVGFCPEIAAPVPDIEEDIDVLFVGSVNPRRAAVLEALSARGLRVEARFGVYGAERDDLAARAKIVLNVHYYEARVFEIVRVSHMLARHRFVVSETGADLDEEGEFAPGVAFAEYEDLVDTCLYYIARPDLRRRVAAQGFAIMALRDETRFLSPALAALEGAAGTDATPTQFR